MTTPRPRADERERRQEEFCRRRGRGETVADAYLGAGYRARDRHAATVLGHRLAKIPRIKARIEELTEIIGGEKGRALQRLVRNPVCVRAAGLTKEWVLDGLMEVAQRCMQHELILDAEGKPIEVDGPDGKRCLLVGFRPREATRAYELLGKEMGMFTERLDTTHRFEERYRQMTPEEREADAVALAEEVRRLLAERKREEEVAQATDAEAVEIGEDGEPTG